MDSWYFPSRGGAETEGFSNAGLAEFRGNPLQALAREICQNSLDAADGSGRPVRVEFHNTFMEKKDFPGMDQMKKILDACQDFWGQDGDTNTKHFLAQARRSFNSDKFFCAACQRLQYQGRSGSLFSEEYYALGKPGEGEFFLC